MNHAPRLPYGYEGNVTCTTDKAGRMAINWPEGCRGTVISRDTLDAIVAENNNCPRWIPVEERLPEGDEPEAVLGWNGIRVHEVVFCPRCKEGDQWSSFGGHEYVTHWMPMPEPPQ